MDAQTATIPHPADRLAGALMIVVALLFLALGILGWATVHQSHRAAKAERSFTLAEGRIQEQAQELAKAKADLAQVHAANEVKQKALVPLQARLKAHPRPVSPPKVTDPGEQQVQLINLGVLTPLPQPERERVFQWSQDSLMLPKVVERLDASEALNAGQATVIDGLHMEVQKHVEVEAAKDKIIVSKTEQVTALGAQLTAEVKGKRLEGAKKYLYGAGGVLLGVLIHKGVSR